MSKVYGFLRDVTLSSVILPGNFTGNDVKYCESRNLK
jgi:hypothetical protein